MFQFTLTEQITNVLSIQSSDSLKSIQNATLVNATVKPLPVFFYITIDLSVKESVEKGTRETQKSTACSRWTTW